MHSIKGLRKISNQITMNQIWYDNKKRGQLWITDRSMRTSMREKRERRKKALLATNHRSSHHTCCPLTPRSFQRNSKRWCSPLEKLHMSLECRGFFHLLVRALHVLANLHLPVNISPLYFFNIKVGPSSPNCSKSTEFRFILTN
jgi:hypothetical protein